MTECDDQEHKRVRTVLDDVADANDARYAEWLRFKGVKPMPINEADMFTDADFEPRIEKVAIDTDPRIENSGKPLRIRGMIEDGKLYDPGEDQ
jgi:hypothetical protein